MSVRRHLLLHQPSRSRPPPPSYLSPSRGGGVQVDPRGGWGGPQEEEEGFRGRGTTPRQGRDVSFVSQHRGDVDDEDEDHPQGRPRLLSSQSQSKTPLPPALCDWPEGTFLEKPWLPVLNGDGGYDGPFQSFIGDVVDDDDDDEEVDIDDVDDVFMPTSPLESSVGVVAGGGAGGPLPPPSSSASRPRSFPRHSSKKPSKGPLITYLTDDDSLPMLGLENISSVLPSSSALPSFADQPSAHQHHPVRTPEQSSVLPPFTSPPLSQYHHHQPPPHQHQQQPSYALMRSPGHLFSARSQEHIPYSSPPVAPLSHHPASHPVPHVSPHPPVHAAQPLHQTPQPVRAPHPAHVATQPGHAPLPSHYPQPAHAASPHPARAASPHPPAHTAPPPHQQHPPPTRVSPHPTQHPAAGRDFSPPPPPPQSQPRPVAPVSPLEGRRGLSPPPKPAREMTGRRRVSEENGDSSDSSMPFGYTRDQLQEAVDRARQLPRTPPSHPHPRPHPHGPPYGSSSQLGQMEDPRGLGSNTSLHRGAPPTRQGLVNLDPSAYLDMMEPSVVRRPFPQQQQQYPQPWEGGRPPQPWGSREVSPQRPMVARDPSPQRPVYRDASPQRPVYRDPSPHIVAAGAVPPPSRVPPDEMDYQPSWRSPPGRGDAVTTPRGRGPSPVDREPLPRAKNVFLPSRTMLPPQPVAARGSREPSPGERGVAYPPPPPPAAAGRDGVVRGEPVYGSRYPSPGGPPPLSRSREASPGERFGPPPAVGPAAGRAISPAERGAGGVGVPPPPFDRDPHHHPGRRDVSPPAPRSSAASPWDYPRDRDRREVSPYASRGRPVHRGPPYTGSAAQEQPWAARSPPPPAPQRDISPRGPPRGILRGHEPPPPPLAGRGEQPPLHWGSGARDPSPHSPGRDGSRSRDPSPWSRERDLSPRGLRERGEQPGWPERAGRQVSPQRPPLSAEQPPPRSRSREASPWDRRDRDSRDLSPRSPRDPWTRGDPSSPWSRGEGRDFQPPKSPREPLDVPPAPWQGAPYYVSDLAPYREAAGGGGGGPGSVSSSGRGSGGPRSAGSYPPPADEFSHSSGLGSRNTSHSGPSGYPPGGYPPDTLSHSSGIGSRNTSHSTGSSLPPAHGRLLSRPSLSHSSLLMLTPDPDLSRDSGGLFLDGSSGHHSRRDTSADENYEFDSIGGLEGDILDTLRSYPYFGDTSLSDRGRDPVVPSRGSTSGLGSRRPGRFSESSSNDRRFERLREEFKQYRERMMHDPFSGYPPPPPPLLPADSLPRYPMDSDML